MSQILEAAMLICFGFSWPMSVIKNIKAKTAKSMSLQFILLIIIGYVAGIAAKLYTNTLNYVLVVYILNLVIVSVNVPVYFINRRHDRLAAEAANSKEESSMTQSAEQISPQVAAKINQYEQVNQVAKQHGTVLFGSSYLYELPICELLQDADADLTVHNRSIPALTIEQAGTVLEPCVLALSPEKIFISLGDEDVKRPEFHAEQFLEQYQWLLYTLHSRSKAKIYIVSVLSDLPAAQVVNRRLQQLAKDTGCQYVDGVSALQNQSPRLKLFEMLRFYIRRRPISFQDAMSHS